MENKQIILEKYLKWVDEVSEDLDWKTHFTPQEIVYKICELIEEENNNYEK